MKSKEVLKLGQATLLTLGNQHYYNEAKGKSNSIIIKGSLIDPFAKKK